MMVCSQMQHIHMSTGRFSFQFNYFISTKLYKVTNKQRNVHLSPNLMHRSAIWATDVPLS